MTECAELIRSELARSGIARRSVSVQCRRSWVIHVETLDAGIDRDAVLAAVKRAYYAKKHDWLVVRCDSHWLDMSAEAAGKGER